VITNYLVLFNPYENAEKIRQIIDQAGIQTWLVNLAWGLIIFFFILALYRALITQSPSDALEALLRAGIAGFLVKNSWILTDFAVDFFEFAHSLGSHVLHNLGDWNTLQAVTADLQSMVNLVKAPGFIEAVTNTGRAMLMAVYAAMVNLGVAVFWALTMALYNFMVFMALVTLKIAILLAPLVFAMVITRYTQRFLWEWLQVILHAALVVMLAQVLIGFVIQDAVASHVRKMVELVNTGQLSPGDMFRFPFQVILGLLIGFFAMLNVQGIASAFVGRVESVFGATMAAVYAGRVAGGLFSRTAGYVTERAVRGVRLAAQAQGEGGGGQPGGGQPGGGTGGPPTAQPTGSISMGPSGGTVDFSSQVATVGSGQIPWMPHV
jgi:hypothetical protein